MFIECTKFQEELNADDVNQKNACRMWIIIKIVNVPFHADEVNEEEKSKPQQKWENYK